MHHHHSFIHSDSIDREQTKSDKTTTKIASTSRSVYTPKYTSSMTFSSIYGYSNHAFATNTNNAITSSTSRPRGAKPIVQIAPKHPSAQQTNKNKHRRIKSFDDEPVLTSLKSDAATRSRTSDLSSSSSCVVIVVVRRASSCSHRKHISNQIKRNEETGQCHYTSSEAGGTSSQSPSL